MEILDNFDKLYSQMVDLNNPQTLQVFKETMRSMMKCIAEWNLDAAQEFICKLESINWNNYLSEKEARTIVGNMNPSGGWNISDWERLMGAENYSFENCPYYNKWALYVAMNMIYSDSMETIAKIKGKALENLSEEEIFIAVYMLALDKLKDKDGMFNIRAYFHV